MTLVEACVTSVDEAVASVAAGADRIELCSDLAVGGLTPSDGLLAGVRARVEVPMMVMLRPRAGAHRFSKAEIAAMCARAAELVRGGADGLVLGVLDAGGGIAEEALRLLMDSAGGTPVTFHRAFDETPDPLRALECLAEAGMARILTGGGEGSAWQGRAMLRALVGRAGDRLTLLGGGGVRADHVVRLVGETGLAEVHARASAIPALVAALRSGDPTSSRRHDSGRFPQ